MSKYQTTPVNEVQIEYAVPLVFFECSLQLHVMSLFVSINQCPLYPMSATVQPFWEPVCTANHAICSRRCKLTDLLTVSLLGGVLFACLPISLQTRPLNCVTCQNQTRAACNATPTESEYHLATPTCSESGSNTNSAESTLQSSSGNSASLVCLLLGLSWGEKGRGYWHHGRRGLSMHETRVRVFG